MFLIPQHHYWDIRWTSATQHAGVEQLHPSKVGLDMIKSRREFLHGCLTSISFFEPKYYMLQWMTVKGNIPQYNDILID